MNYSLDELDYAVIRCCLLDKIDFDLIKEYTWYIDRGYLKGNKGGYEGQYLHNIVAERMGLDLSNDVDHCDNHTSNNKRNNLRSATRSQNQANVKRQKNNTSGFKGVSAFGGKWKAQIGVNYEHIYLGLFDSPEEAHVAYCEAAKEHFGEFANAV